MAPESFEARGKTCDLFKCRSERQLVSASQSDKATVTMSSFVYCTQVGLPKPVSPS